MDHLFYKYQVLVPYGVHISIIVAGRRNQQGGDHHANKAKGLAPSPPGTSRLVTVSSFQPALLIGCWAGVDACLGGRFIAIALEHRLIATFLNIIRIFIPPLLRHSSTNLYFIRGGDDACPFIRGNNHLRRVCKLRMY
jgi:hypothetical protein